MLSLLRSSVLAVASAVLAVSPASAESHNYITAENALSPRDEAELRQVIARLNHALDVADYSLYGSFFADDGVFESGFGNAKGPDQVAAALEKVAPFITNKRHVAGNLVISGTGDEAVVTSYLIVFERVADLSYVGSAISVDTLRRVEGVWKVTNHSSTLDPATLKAIRAQMQ